MEDEYYYFTLREYLKIINRFVETYPSTLDMQVIYSIDDEGNKFKPVIYEPSTGHFDEDNNTYLDDKDKGKKERNAVCVN